MNPQFNSQPNADQGPSNVDCDLRHHLRNTIVLLGGDEQIADLLSKSEDYASTEDDVLTVKRYNMALIEGLKMRLARLPVLKLETTK